MLSDICAEFLEEVTGSISSLAQGAKFCAEDATYGDERRAIQLLAEKAAADPQRYFWQLISLAKAVQIYHDTPPGGPEQASRKEIMDREAATVLGQFNG